MRKRIFLLLLTAMSGAVLIGCSDTSEMEICQKIFKGTLERILKDPFSAQYKNWNIVSYYEGKCVGSVWVNAKNSYGGYVGWREYSCSPSVGCICLEC